MESARAASSARGGIAAVQSRSGASGPSRPLRPVSGSSAGSKSGRSSYAIPTLADPRRLRRRVQASTRLCDGADQEPLPEQPADLITADDSSDASARACVRGVASRGSEEVEAE